MSAKNIVVKNWSLLPSFDGLLYSQWPLGDKPSPAQTGAPIILYTDITSGPTNNGEGSAGCYLSIYGLNLGAFADYGTLNHVKIGGQEVANYRCLVKAVGLGSGGRGSGVYETFGIKRLTVQVGSAGVQGLTPGTAYAISVLVGGFTSNANDLDGNALTFTPNPGPMIYLDPVNGNDANAGTIASPMKTLQTYNGTGNFTGALFCSGSVGGATTGNTCLPGTHVILRAGTYNTHLVSASKGNRWACLWQLTGIPPSGASNTGPIVITSYPGAAGANTPEVASYVGTSSSDGGIHGTDSARSIASIPWSTAGLAHVGFGQYIHISNISITANPSGSSSGGSATSDGAPINLQNRGDFWRVVNCELVWKMDSVPALAAGIANAGVSVRRFGNYIHDIYGDVSAQENHGIYAGAGGGNNEQNSVTAFNCINHITGGSGIQFHTGSGDGGAFYTNCDVHHNWVQDVIKHGFNGATGWSSGKIYDNVFVDAQQYAVYFGTNNITAAQGTKVTNNTIVGWAQKSDSLGYSAIFNNAPISGTILAQNNVFYQRAATTQTSYAFTGGSSIVLDKNCWYDASSRLTVKPSGDATGFYGNPLFNLLTSLDLTPGLSSPLPNAGVTPPAQGAIAYDFALNVRPQGVNPNISIGAYEKVG